jgi:hypothetical protein
VSRCTLYLGYRVELLRHSVCMLLGISPPEHPWKGHALVEEISFPSGIDVLVDCCSGADYRVGNEAMVWSPSIVKGLSQCVPGYHFGVSIFTICVEYKWTKTHGYFIQMGGFMLYDKKPIQVLSPEHFGRLLREKRIDMPSINEEEIQDRSKSDGLAKALVIIQTLWFIGQCIVRMAQGLDITELELVTLALAMLNGVVYFLWWNKPLGVESTVAVYLKPPPVAGDKDMSIGM